jgi:Protein of unknown function (DUF2567)
MSDAHAPARSGTGHGDAWASRRELIAGSYLVAGLAVLGAVLGVLWQWWSPPGPLGYVVAPRAIQPAESEAFIAADGRFALICASTGLVAGLAAWSHKPSRGPVTALALAVGGMLGSLLTDLVGHLLGGGSSDGKQGTILHELPLSVHMRGLLLLEAALAVLVYGLCVSFAAADDLGRPDKPSVRVADEMQFGAGDRNAAGAVQQQYFPPQ